MGGDGRRVPVGPEGPPVRVRRRRDPVEPGTGGDARADRRPAGDRAGLHRLLQPGEPGVRHRRGRRGGRLSRHRDSRGPRTELRLLPETAARGGARAPRALHRRGAGGRPAGRLRSALRAGLRAGRRVAGRLPRRDGVRGAVRTPVRGAARRVQRHASLRRRHGARGRLAQGGERGDRSRRAGPRTRDVRGRGGHVPFRRTPTRPIGGPDPGALRGTFVRWERGGARIVFPPRYPWRLPFPRCSSTASSPGGRTP